MGSFAPFRGGFTPPPFNSPNPAGSGKDLGTLAALQTQSQVNPFQRQTVTGDTFQQATLPFGGQGKFGRQDQSVQATPQQGLALGNRGLSKELLNTFAGGANANSLQGILREQSPDIPKGLATKEEAKPARQQFGGK